MATTIERLQVEVGGDTSDAVEALEELEDAGSEIPNWVGGAAAALGGLFAIGAGAGAALTAGVIGNIDASEAHNKLAAQLALTGPESERMGEVAGSLYSNAYGESMAEVDEAIGAVVSSVDGMRDASAPILEDATADVLNFATAFDTDVARSAQIAGQLVKQGLAGDFDEAMDLMTAASQKVPAAIREDVLDASDEYGGLFEQLGFTGEEAFTALVNASDKGAIGIDKTADALKEFTILATDGSAAEVLDGIGLSAEEMATKVATGGPEAADALSQIVAGIQGIEDPAEKAQAAIALFGTPLEDLGTSDVPQFLDSLSGLEDGLGDTAGAASAMGDTLNSGPGSALATLKRTVETAFMQFSDWVIPLITRFAVVLTGQVQPAVESVISFITGTMIPGLKSAAAFVARNSDAFVIAAGVITAIFLPALIKLAAQSAIATARVVAGWIAQQAAAVAAGAAVWAQVVRTVAGWVTMAAQAAANAARVVAGWVVMGAQSMIQGARMAAAWVLAMGPVGWVIAAVVALVALIIANWDTVSAATAAIWGAIVGWVTGAWTAITTWVSTAVAAVSAVITTVFSAIAAFVQAHVAAVLLIMTTVWTAIQTAVTAVVNAIRAVIAAVFSAIVTVITTYVNVWLAIIQAIWTVISTVVSAGVEAVRSVISAVFSAISGVISGIVEGWRSAVSGVMSAIGGLVSSGVESVKGFIGGLSSIGTTVSGYFESARSGAKQKLDELVEFVKGVPESIKNGLSSIGTKLYSSGRALLQGFLDGIMSMVQTIKDKVSGFVSGVRDYFPFSPAKTGPFSGKGYVSYSGEAIGRDFADSIAAQAGLAERAAGRLMAAAALDVPAVDPRRAPRGGGAFRPTTAGVGAAEGQGGTTVLEVTVVDADGVLVGKMRSEAGKVMTGRVTPLDEDKADW